MHACRILQGLAGMGACMLPGSTLGKNSTLGVGAAAPSGTELQQQTLFWGAPAQPLSQQQQANPGQGPQGVLENIALVLLPIAQPFLIAWLVMLPAYPVGAAAVMIQYCWGPWAALGTSPVLFLAFGAVFTAAVVIFKWAVVGRILPTEFSRWAPDWYRIAGFNLLR